MASCYTDHTQSDDSISDQLSPADSSHATLSTSLTQSLVSLDFTTSADRPYKPKTRKRKFYGNRHTSKILGGRLVGIGFNKLSFYHSALNIPSPPSRQILRVLSKIF